MTSIQLLQLASRVILIAAFHLDQLPALRVLCAANLLGLAVLLATRILSHERVGLGLPLPQHRLDLLDPTTVCLAGLAAGEAEIV